MGKIIQGIGIIQVIIYKEQQLIVSDLVFPEAKYADIL